MTYSLQDGGARFPAHRRKANRCAVGKQSSELGNSAKKIPYMRERKTSIQAQWRTLVSLRAAQAQRGDRVGGGRRLLFEGQDCWVRIAYREHHKFRWGDHVYDGAPANAASHCSSSVCWG